MSGTWDGVLGGCLGYDMDLRYGYFEWYLDWILLISLVGSKSLFSNWDPYWLTCCSLACLTVSLCFGCPSWAHSDPQKHRSLNSMFKMLDPRWRISGISDTVTHQKNPHGSTVLFSFHQQQECGYSLHSSSPLAFGNLDLCQLSTSLHHTWTPDQLDLSSGWFEMTTTPKKKLQKLSTQVSNFQKPNQWDFHYTCCWLIGILIASYSGIPLQLRITYITQPTRGFLGLRPAPIGPSLRRGPRCQRHKVLGAFKDETQLVELSWWVFTNPSEKYYSKSNWITSPSTSKTKKMSETT